MYTFIQVYIIKIKPRTIQPLDKTKNFRWFSRKPWSCLRPQNCPRIPSSQALGHWLQQLARRQWERRGQICQVQTSLLRPDSGPTESLMRTVESRAWSTERMLRGWGHRTEWWPASATCPSPSPPPWSTSSPGPSSSRSSSSWSCSESRTATGTAPGYFLWIIFVLWYYEGT